VHGVHDRRLDELAEDRSERPRMVVDHVELARLFERVEQVAQVGHRPADQLARRGRVHGLELRVGARVPGGEERHLVTLRRQPFGQQPDDPLDPAVARSAAPGTTAGSQFRFSQRHILTADAWDGDFRRTHEHSSYVLRAASQATPHASILTLRQR
jgi:hypothetical protein